ncbi:MAG: hypothetical protein ACI3XR_10020 [Eubacteriales bacterium]
MICEKQTKSGKLLEVDFYPVWRDGRKMATRAPKTKRTTPEMVRYNRNQAKKQVVRLVNANFDDDDIIMHPTYRQECAPKSEEQARKDMQNFIRRVKTKRKTCLKKVIATLNALPDIPALLDQRKELQKLKAKLEAPLKYIYVIEKVTYKSGKYKGRDNYHFHLFLTGGIDRKVLESMWPAGVRVNADRFQPERYGPEAICKYMLKGPEGSKQYCCSRNLDKPVTRCKHSGRTTPDKVARMAKQRVDDADYWERRYKGYVFLRCYSRYNNYNGHWYVTAVMYRKSDQPDDLRPRWEDNDWMTEDY